MLASFTLAFSVQRLQTMNTSSTLLQIIHWKFQIWTWWRNISLLAFINPIPGVCVCVCFFILSSLWNIELWLNYNLLIIASKTKFVNQFSVTRSLKLSYVSCRLTMIYDFLPIVQLEQDNLNSKTYLSSIKVQVMESLRSIQHAPGVQMQEVRLSLLGCWIYTLALAWWNLPSENCYV